MIKRPRRPRRSIGAAGLSIWILASLAYAPAIGAFDAIEHVVVIGCDGMSPDGIRNADTPNMDRIMREGAYTFHARAVMPTVSSPNWASMISGAGPEQHGVLDNDWQPGKSILTPTAEGTAPGVFPTMFGVLRAARPSATICVVHDWGGFGRLFEREAVSLVEHVGGSDKASKRAAEVFVDKKPALTFVHLDYADHVGHSNGHGTSAYYESIEAVDAYIGAILEAVKKSGLTETTAVIVTADHGGKGKGHGGATLDEIEIPWLIMGPGMAHGRRITAPVNTYDTAATVLHLLGVEPHKAWIGRPVYQAFPGPKGAGTTLKAVIFAAGKSTRAYPLTLTRPKPLLPVANRTILERQLDALSGLVDEVVVVVGYLGEMVQERFGQRHGETALSFVTQEEQRGTGHALLQCEKHLTGPFLALNGDDLYSAADLEALANASQGGLAKRMEDPRQFGVYEVGENNRLIRVVEKPSDPASNLANAGAYKFEPSVMDTLRKIGPSERGEVEITSAIQALADQGEFSVVEAQGFWTPIGYPWDLLEANTAILGSELREDIRGDVSAAAHIFGAASIGRGTVIRPGVVIDGPVIIGEDCVIGPNAWIRAYTSIGNRCRVGQGSEIKGSIMMDGARVPHLSYVGDSILGEDVNLGCGTVTANFRHDGSNHRSMVKGELIDTGRRKLGAVIGDGVHTGINTSIYPGRKLWPHTSTLPGEVVSQDKQS